MNEFDACVFCPQNCKQCKNAFDCKENFFVLKNTFFECGSVLPSTFLTAVFLDTFVDLRLIFKELNNKLSCEKFFEGFKNETGKLGKNFSCAIEPNSILINLGTESTLVNETIEVFNFYLNEEENNKCSIKTKIEFSAPSPAPIAKILAPNKFILNTDLLKIDRSLSGGRNKGL